MKPIRENRRKERKSYEYSGSGVMKTCLQKQVLKTSALKVVKSAMI